MVFFLNKYCTNIETFCHEAKHVLSLLKISTLEAYWNITIN
jgi:hypothetical protein